MDKLINEICSYIIKTVQLKSNPDFSGFQYVVDIQDINTSFSITINEQMQSEILNNLLCREEVADVVLNDGGFDVVLYTDYAPNYISELFDNWL